MNYLSQYADTSSESPRIALLVETSREFGRSILLGVERYSRLYGPWTFHLFPGDFAQQINEVLTWNATGMIARIGSEEVARQILQSRIPVVALDMHENQRNPGRPFANTSEVRANSVEVGIMAADYYLREKYEHFAFIGEPHGFLWSKQREEGFRLRLREAGYSCHAYRPPYPEINWSEEIVSVGKWLDELPKPVALLAAMDVRGRQVITVCQEYGIQVPDEVAVMGVDNDPLICRMSAPPMSSVAMNIEEGGFQAARILDRIMQRKQKEKVVFQIDPTHIEARDSTKRINLQDVVVVKAIRYIRHNVMRGVTVQEVAKRINVSRRTLELRFRKALNRSVHEEIAQSRLERVKTLVRDTNLNIAEIAEQCNFCSEFYLHRFFLREAGITIRQFRDQEKK